MTSLELIKRMHQHRMWANERLIAAAESLTDAQLRQTFEIGQGSIWKSLTHLFGAEYCWLATLEGDENPVAPGDSPEKLPGNQEGENPFLSLAELRQHWSELDDRWRQYLAELSEAELQRSLSKVSSLSGKRHTTPAYDVLLHLCTHAQYTTAQLVNMLRHAGAETLPDVMLITMSRKEDKSIPN